MALKFKEAIDAVLHKIELPAAEHNSFRQDINKICEQIKQCLSDSDSIFKNSLNDLNKTAVYKKGSGFHVIDDFHCLLSVKMPFKIEPNLKLPPSRELRLKSNVHHPFVRNGYVNALWFNVQVETNLTKAVNKIGHVKCPSGRTYNLRIEPGSKISTDYFMAAAVLKERGQQGNTAVLYAPIEFGRKGGMPYRIIANEKSQTSQETPAEICFTFFPCMELLLNKEQLAQQLFIGVSLGTFWANGMIYFPPGLPLNCESAQNRRDAWQLLSVILSKEQTGYTHLGVDLENLQMAALSIRELNRDDYLLGLVALYIGIVSLGSQNEKLLKLTIDAHDELRYYQLLDSVELPDIMALFGLS